MNALVKRALTSVVGLAIVLAWWSLRPGDSKNVHTAGIPAVVWGGGGAQLTIEAQANCAAYVSISFEGDGGPNGPLADHGLLEAREEIDGGSHTWTIDVPEHVGGMVEMGASQPTTGNQLSWRLLVNGRQVDQQSESLDQPLEKGYAFFLQTAFDDYGSAEVAEDW